MLPRTQMTRRLLDQAFETLAGHLKDLTLEAALFAPPGGFRSILGTLKHAAGWSHVYRSYAFDSRPTHWQELDWPRGLRDSVVTSQAYLDEIVQWLPRSQQLWQECLQRVPDHALDELRPVHWGDQLPLFEIVLVIANHHVYHAGEINQLLSIYRGQAWEDGEEVEENHISTLGHRVFPPWKQRG